MLLSEFKDFIATRLGSDSDLIDFYSLGNKLEGENTEMWRHSYVVPGALIEMRRKRIKPCDSQGSSQA